MYRKNLIIEKPDGLLVFMSCLCCFIGAGAIVDRHLFLSSRGNSSTYNGVPAQIIGGIFCLMSIVMLSKYIVDMKSYSRVVNKWIIANRLEKYLLMLYMLFLSFDPIYKFLWSPYDRIAASFIVVLFVVLSVIIYRFSAMIKG
jgi:hypothetical protein